MKNRSITKFFVLALSLVLFMTAVIGITAYAGNNDSGDIYSTTIVHDDKISLAIAVKATAEEIANGTVVVNYVWENSDDVKTATYGEAHATEEGYVWVVTEGVAAYDLGLNATITSYVKSGDDYVEVESGVYSVATFLYNKLYRDGVEGEAKACYEALLAYGATSQAFLDKNADAPVDELNYAYTTNEDIKINGQSSVFADEVTVAYNGDKNIGGWIVNGVTYPAEQTTFEVNGVTEIEAFEALLTIGEFANGTVTADKASYEVGDTVTLTITANENYAQKLYLNGEPILVDTNSKYSFVIEEGKTYTVTGEFVSKSGWFWIPNNFNMINQGHNVAHASAGSTGELVPTADKCYGGKVLVKDPSSGTKAEYAIAFKMHFADGQKAEVRLIGEKGDGKYRLQVMGNNILGNWSGIYNLSDAENAAIATGDGVWFSMVREGTTIKLLINDNVVKTYDVSANGITADIKVSQFKLQAYNLTTETDIPYVFYMAE